jgi:hypothetical protein
MMNAYVESGRNAQRLLLEAKSSAQQQRLIASLRGFKLVINLLGVAAIVAVPAVGALFWSAPAAAGVALNFLAVIVVLELMERRVKTELAAVREQRQSAPSA